MSVHDTIAVASNPQLTPAPARVEGGSVDAAQGAWAGAGERGRPFRSSAAAEGATTPESLRQKGPRRPIDTLESGMWASARTPTEGVTRHIRGKLSGSVTEGDIRIDGGPRAPHATGLL